jgi:hypothetical protein
MSPPIPIDSTALLGKTKVTANPTSVEAISRANATTFGA